jgi:hypothetical protein
VTPEQVFSIVNLVAMAGWILLVVLPRQRWVTAIVTGLIVPVPFAILYSAIVFATFSSAPSGGGGFLTLAGVAALFSNPWTLLAGWVHYLTFDLLIGTWEVRDSQERGLSHLLVVPCLVLTFMLGPAGWLLYMGVRSARASGTRQRVVEGT